MIAGRALRALGSIGGEPAARLIERAVDSHPDPYVRAAALKALLRMASPSSVAVLVRASQQHPSAILRARVRARLAQLGVAVPGPTSEPPQHGRGAP